MIPVQPAPEPERFDEVVRKPGLSAIAELVGEPATLKRPGFKRKTVCTQREDLKSNHFPPFWREVTDDLLTAYHRICAYACLYIEPVTGAATVDHFAPKSMSWDKVYEWDNYRLACSLMNSRKSVYEDVFDPFHDVDHGLFALDCVTLKAIPGPNAGSRQQAVTQTIKRLGLDGHDYAEALGDYYHPYLEGDISLAHLEKRAPFLAQELRRQGKLLPKDVKERKIPC